MTPDERAADPESRSTRPVPTDPTLDDLPWLIDDGLRLVRERRQASGLGIYGSIENQLEYLRTRVEDCERPPDDVLASLTLGVYAAREFETSDPHFADILFAVEYLAKRM